MRGVMRLMTDSAGGQAILTDNGSVFVNGKPAMRLGDRVAAHDAHAPYLPMVTANPSVFVEGKAVCGAGDQASCEHAATGSTNVFVP